MSEAEYVLKGSTVHSARGISGCFTGGATGTRSSAAGAAAWPSAPGTGHGGRSQDSLRAQAPR